MKYILATHTGKNFYTHEDRLRMPNFSYSGGLAIVDGVYQGWVSRVNGKEITELEAETLIKKRLEKTNTLEIIEKEAELVILKAKTFTNVLLK